MAILLNCLQTGQLKAIDATVAADHAVSPPSGGFGPNVQPRALVIKTIKAEGVSSDCVISFGFNANCDDVVKTYVVRPKTEANEIVIVSLPIFEFNDTSFPFTGVASASLRIVTPATATAFTFSYGFVYNEGYDPTDQPYVAELLVN